MDSLETARNAGTPEEVVKRCLAPDFLAVCLVKAGFDNELCTDCADACEVAELSVLDLARLGDVEDAAKRLFLVNDEARYLGCQCLCRSGSLCSINVVCSCA